MIYQDTKLWGTLKRSRMSETITNKNYNTLFNGIAN